ncbi:alpha/beta fold hydrolase [Halopelagius longus]|uniref:Alpha/beta hydrolase n=1 Tax=Halopelagius longus TaxID=1236180 RepID=A0A1H1B8T3_9EURY|nr:alpha/beta hydrolase [Halopelagius longus]RDI70688.1 alpha/beta hydrolase [Halopelagius longus]SDQ48337.1 Pimeloyl-ACP methyl ester carboxylesterase [Halopelagius longus]
MRTVTSADGTEIAYEREGSGPSLVLLHGGSGTRRAWDRLRPHLADDFTLVVPDRRGRGDSGDADEYHLDREVADVRALVDAVDGETTVFGHSFGGLVALAAATEVDVDRLVLYEPAVLVGDHRDDDLADRMRESLDAGDRERAMKLFYRDAGGVPKPERLPFWPEEVNFDLVETVIRENYAVEEYDLPEDMGVDAPTLLLTGEHGPAHLRDAAFELDERLPESRLTELDGVGHVATDSAPDRVAAAIRAFVRETRPRE